MAERILIPLEKIVSPKEAINYRTRTKTSFMAFVEAIRSNTVPVLPIEVYRLTDGRYYIADGINRAKATLLAGKKSIIADLHGKSKATDTFFPLAEVTF